MAKLPSLELERRPTPQPAGGISSYRGPGGAETAPGEAMSRLGESMARMGEQTTRLGDTAMRAGNEVFAAFKAEEEKTNTLRAEEAFSQLRERQLDLTNGPQNGYLNKKGSDALNRPLGKEWGERFNQAYKEIESGLGNDEQKAKFKQRATIARLQYDEGILGHLAKQNEVFAKEVFDGTLKTEVRAAAAQWQSPIDVGTSVERIRNAVESQAQRQGWPAEYKEAMFQQAAGQVHSAVIGQALASGQLEYAENWYKKNRADIDPATAKALEKAVEDGTQKQLSNGYRADMLAGQNNYQVLAKLRDRVLADGKLDDARRNAIVGPIQNQMFALERRAEAARERQEKRLEKVIDGFNADTLAGFPSTDPQRGLDLVNATRGTPLAEQAQQAFALANATRGFSALTPRQQEQQLATAEAAVREDPRKFDRKILTAWQGIASQQKEQVQKDPVSFAVRQGIAPPKPIDLSQPSTLGAQLAERFDIARQMEAKYNAPFKPLTTEEQALLRAVMKNAPAEQKRQYFSGLAQAAGSDYQGYSGIMAQLAPDDPVTAQAGLYAYRGRTQAAGLMLDGLQLLNPPSKSDGKPDQGKLWPMPPEAELRKGFQSYEKDAFAGHAGARNSMYQAATAIYAAKSKDEGDASGVINSGRWDDAIKLATGGIEKYRGKAIVLPYGLEYGQFKTELGRRIDQVVDQGRLAKGMDRDRLTDMPLEAVGDGRYVFKAGDGVLVDKDNRPIVIDFTVSAPFRSSGSGEAPPEKPTKRSGRSSGK